MSANDSNTNTVCTCGRVYTHCRSCGSRNIYVKGFRSLELSASIGKQVNVFRCRRCGNETNETQECTALLINKPNPVQAFVPFQKAVELPAWGVAVPGTNEHLKLLNEWITHHQQSKGWDRIQVYVEAQKAGWHLEAYDMEEDVKAALLEQGLTPSKSESESTKKEKETPVTAGTVISLDDIIKQMQVSK